MNLRITPPRASRKTPQFQGGKGICHNPRPVPPRSPRGTKGR
ncbi:hypothetical protein [Nonomuraea rhodomycinica]|nr:hypothetical protein [Nonomuraea rhodomycinica]